MIFIFANFFFKIHFGHFLCPISKLKKKFWKLRFFPFFWLFFNFKKSLFIPTKIDISYFFMKIAFLGELLIILHFLILICFILINYLYFLSYIIPKYLIWIIFLLKCSYKVVQKLSKVVQKLSNRSEKNQKKSKKSRKNRIFSFFFLWSQSNICQKTTHHLS